MDKLTRGWVHHLRKTARQELVCRGSCPLCDAEIEPDIDSFKAHVRADVTRHPTLSRDSDIEEAFKNVTIRGYSVSPDVYTGVHHSLSTALERPDRKRPVPGASDSLERVDNAKPMPPILQRMDPSQPDQKKLCSPPGPKTSPRDTTTAQSQADASSPLPSARRARLRLSDIVNDFDRGLGFNSPTRRQLWNPENGTGPVPPQSPSSAHASPISTRKPVLAMEDAHTHHTRRRQRHQQPQHQPRLHAHPHPHPHHQHQHQPHQRQHQQQHQRQNQHHRHYQHQQLQQPQHRLTPLVHSPPRFKTSLTWEMLAEPLTNTISSEDIVDEIKDIYASLVAVENKCREQISSHGSGPISQESYRSLVELHSSALYEHHDFLLACQHPSGNESLRRLASKYAMPARMWRHGIHSFLELLRHRLPDSLEHMLTFIYDAYAMVGLFYETVPAFEETWIECLGDLSRYRMAIEESDIRDRDVWNGVSRHWYTLASDRSPTTGRLYHHLAILARPNAVQQLYYYAKSLSVPEPFASARESIGTLFDPLLNTTSSRGRSEEVDAAFVRAHGILFTGRAMEQLAASIDTFLRLLDGRIASKRSSWLEAGYHIAISLSCSMLEFGAESSVLRTAMSAQAEGTGTLDGDGAEGPLVRARAGERFEKALSLAVRTYEIVLRRWGDKNTLPCLHSTLVFLHHLRRHPDAMSYIEDEYPWKLTSMVLNHLMKTSELEPKTMDEDRFPGPEKGDGPWPLPEDYALRGLNYAEDYFPADWFANDKKDVVDRWLEPASKTLERTERILWLGRRIAQSGRWLIWDGEQRTFSVAEKYEVEVKGGPGEARDEMTGRGPRLMDMDAGEEEV